MAIESVKFTIELGGNAYSGVAQLDSAVPLRLNLLSLFWLLFGDLDDCVQ